MLGFFQVAFRQGPIADKSLNDQLGCDFHSLASKHPKPTRLLLANVEELSAHRFLHRRPRPALQPGRHDAPTHVDAWSGGAVGVSGLPGARARFTRFPSKFSMRRARFLQRNKRLRCAFLPTTRALPR